MALEGVRNRVSQASYLDVTMGSGTPEYELMGTGFKELNEEPQAQTSSKKYVNNKSATKGITSYDWQTPYNADQILSEKAVQCIVNVGKLQKVGSDAETKYIVVDLDDPATNPNEFKARLFDVAIEVASFTDEDGEMGAEGNLLGMGDPVQGTFDTTAKTFTPDVVVGP